MVGDLGVLPPDAVRGERGGLASMPGGGLVLLLSSILVSCVMGEAEASLTFLSALVSNLVHVTMSVLSSNGRGNFPPERERGGGREGRREGEREGGRREREGKIESCINRQVLAYV